MTVQSVTPADQVAISALYAAFWNRAPDTTGFGYWCEILASGKATLDEIATTMRNLPEGEAAYPYWSTNAQLVTEVYQNVFNRAPDAQGLAFWTQALDQGRATFPELVVDMVEAAETNGSADGALFTNKINVGIYVATVAQTDNGYVTANAFNLLTADPASVQTAEAWVDANNTGATYTLTTNIDTINVEGQAVNTVVGVQQATNATWNTGDTINGNGKTNISLVGNGDGVAGAAIAIVDANNIASVNVNLAASTTLDSTEFTNVAQVGVTSGGTSKTLTVEQATLATTYAINQARATTIDLNTFSDALTGTADTLNLSVAGAGSKITAAGTFDLSSKAIEIVNLATSGTNYVALANAGSVEEINITGNGTNSVNVGAKLATGVSITGGTGTDTIYGAPAAGTSAATLTGVEGVDVVFGNAGTYVSGVKWTGVTTVAANALSNEAINFTSLNSSVTTVNINSEATDSSDAVNVAYTSGSKGDLTVNVGSTGADVDVGTLTVTNLTGALTVNGAGKATYGGETVANVTDTKATSVNVNAVSSSIDITGALTAVAASGYSLSAVAGLTADVNRIDIGKADANYAGEIAEIALSATGLDSTGTVGSTAVTALNTIDIAATGSMTVDLVTLVSDVDGLVSFTATQADNTDDVTISVIDATGAAGDGVVINLSDIRLNASTVSTGDGSATVDLTYKADTFNGGAGDVTVTTTDGADTINGGSGVDTVIMSTDNDGIQFNSFAAGKAGDVANFDVSAWEAPVDSAGSAVAAGAIVAAKLASGAAYTFAASAAADIMVLTGVIANDAALEVNMETYMAVTSGSLTDGMDILVAYYDGYSTQLRSVDLTTISGSDVVAATVVAGGATLTGVSTADLIAGNFYAS